MKVFCLLGGQDEHRLQQSMLLYYGSCFLLHSSLGSLKQFLVFLEVYFWQSSPVIGQL